MKRFILSILFLFLMAAPVFGQTPQYMPWQVRDAIVSGLDDSQHCGIFAPNNEYHIIPLDKEKMEQYIHQVEERMGGVKSGIIVEEPMKYSYQQLLDAQDRVWARNEEFGVLNASPAIHENAVEFGAEKWTEENKQAVREVAQIDNIIFLEFVPYSKTIENPRGRQRRVVSRFSHVPVDPSLRRRVDAGTIWIDRARLDVSKVTVEGDTIVVEIINTTAEKEQYVKDIVPQSQGHIRFVSVPRKQETEIPDCKFKIVAGRNYLEFDGMLFMMEKAPYIENDEIMLPLEDICDVLKNVLGNRYIQSLEDFRSIVFQEINVIPNGIEVVPSIGGYRYTNPIYEQHITKLNGYKEFNSVIYFPFPMDFKNQGKYIYLNAYSL